MDAGPLKLEIRRESPAVCINGRVGNAVGDAVESSPWRTTMLHAKRDGQVCFLFADALTGRALGSTAEHGQPGDVFVFGGDETGGGEERRGQILFVYGPDHAFVEPFDRGFTPRGYEWVGRVDDIAELHRLGEEIWRHGAVEIELRTTP